MYTAIIIVTTLLLAVYAVLILQYRSWFLRLRPFEPAPVPGAPTRFSIIIPARNEEGQIGNCLASIFGQSYPGTHFEVIIVNDHSTDRTEAVVKAWQAQHANLCLINMADHVEPNALNSYKKKALELAIATSSGEWVVTTDADCQAKPGWLSLLDAYIRQYQPVFVAAPVMFTTKGNFLDTFQLLDFISLQGITAAAVSAGFHTMCNGANLAYRKDVFYAVDGFKGIDGLASGDDMFLMHKIKQLYPNRMGYLFAQGAIMATAPMADWRSFINQRIRWASKADAYQDRGIFRTLALVYALNACLFLWLVGSLFFTGGWVPWLIFIAIKTLVELSFMIPVSKFYGHLPAMYWFLPMQPFHIAYTVVAGWLGKFGSYQWKGRKVQ
ncbi:Glycosyltransferase, catalytic subunit of cellulose synthase and poly-beta-1,6-N-acetylglucosamine synthase [Hydrobacter penzbergensis]|uniref:Glycosyltransferase, catalytic subunit of cellulose synthase and poly-beta-1,6-N-acetylglucosamine synthase n=1 Tax=Hydrobacter penzbergensis TaxID=1235997 RepID=A0A8X8LET0_9BACT|nr:glycosyltransferase [Hydrobacter penzbergensis]SDW76778.1 Glycosyltransferase, catalytic subunit of cellulose synthase and poly-beta-1,6-N-acetylglucosamine synthase [Hydrobacter penzbergensis]